MPSTAVSTQRTYEYDIRFPEIRACVDCGRETLHAVCPACGSTAIVPVVWQARFCFGCGAAIPPTPIGQCLACLAARTAPPF